MYIFLIFAMCFAAISSAINAQNFAYSTDELEKFILEATHNNATRDFDFSSYKSNPCQPYKPVKPDFRAPGRRISEQKCLEYIWEMANRENETEWGQECELYLADYEVTGPVVYGGRGAIVAEFPHMGAIGWRASDASVGWVFKCGSTLISEKFVLTAAHCSKLSVRRNPDVQQSEPELVRLGVDDIDYNANYDIKIKRFIVHPEYESPKKYNDIAIIELEKDVKFMNKLQPSCLWSSNELNRLGSEGILTGWGNTESGAPSTILLAALVDFIDSSECDNLLMDHRNRNWNGLRENQLCAGKFQGGIDTCQGDSGGPLQVRIPLTTIGKMYWTVGITSFGIQCGEKNQPGIYTRVSSFIDWIEEIVWASEKNM